MKKVIKKSKQNGTYAPQCIYFQFENEGWSYSTKRWYKPLLSTFTPSYETLEEVKIFSPKWGAMCLLYYSQS